MEKEALQYINDLIVRIAEGDGGAVDLIYQKIGGRMLSVALGIVKNRHTAEDVVQNSFIKITQNADKFYRRDNGCAWICKIVSNTALNAYKSERGKQCEDIDSFYNLSSAIDEAEKSNTNMMVEKAMQGLPHINRQIIWYKYFCDYTVREIAKLVNLPKSTVQNLVRQSEEIMRNILK